MPLQTGSRLGPYEIVAPLGAGGMGEVYRARDTRLERDVAIKALPEAVAGAADRLARFEREAKLLASLSHPNIAAIFGLEDAGGAIHLVLELVDGETLAERLARGPLSVRETLELGEQIASAIEAAHERGIVHRDLKPGNVMLTGSGAAKVLDFGLAKGGEESVSSSNLSASPTLARSATADGLILGTAPYMSPEQARGRPVDRRADVWAFGCLLFECLTGRPAFAGETVSDVIAHVLEREPDWSTLPPSVPLRLQTLVRRCLTKDTRERPRDMGDLRSEIHAIGLELSSPASGVIARPGVPSLAVLYFENPASDTESEYFCAGITEDILTDLSKIKGLRVASRNAVARYRGTRVDIARAAAELGVGAVLEGSVRRVGDRVRITAQLISASDGFHLWAERYDRTLQDVFAVQEEIASAIATALRVTLTPAESENLVRDRPNDVRAYDLYLKGRQRYSTYTAEGLKEALDLFRQATTVDPEYALAWAGLADASAQLHQWSFADDAEELVQLGFEAARKAIALNPQLAEGHKAEALLHHGLGNAEAERAALMRALEANPRFVPAITNLAVGSVSDADIAGAERLLRRGMEIDPQDPFVVMWLAWLLALTGRNDEAAMQAERIRQLGSSEFYVTNSYGIAAWVHMNRGDNAAVERTLREGVANGAERQNMDAIGALAAVRSGRLDDARRIVRELEDVAGIYAGGLMCAAGAAWRLGEPERALRFMTRHVAAPFMPCLARLFPEVHPLLDRQPFAPRRSQLALVWPLEAGMIDPVRLALFREVRIESGLPEESGVRERR